MKLKILWVIILIFLAGLLISLLFSYNKEEKKGEEIINNKKIEQKVPIKDLKYNCNIPRGSCQNKLGDYPYPFINNILIIYSNNVDNLILDDIRVGLNACASIQLLLDKNIINYREYKSNMIIVGNCENKILKDIIDCSNLKQGETIIELKKLNDNYALLLYGKTNDEIKRGAVMLKQYDFLRGRLLQKGLSCGNKIIIGETSLTIDGVIPVQ